MAIPSTGFTFPPANNTDFITELYVGYYNRAPDPAGMNFWLNALTGGETLTQVANQFANSSESTAIYPFLSLPNLVNAGSFVTQVYNNILNRAPDAPGLAFWTAELQSGAVTPGSFILTLEASVNMQTGTADALTLADKGTVAEDYVLRVATANVPFSQASAHAALAPVTNDPTTVATGEAVTTAFIAGAGGSAGTFVFTTAIDNLIGTGSNDTFIGDNSLATATVGAGDSANGGGGIDTFNYFLGGAGTAVVPTLTSIEIVNLIGGTAAQTASFAAQTGITNLNVKNDTAGGDTYTVASGVAVGLDNYQSANSETFVVPASQTSATLNLLNGTRQTGGTVNVNGAALTSLTINSTGSAANTINGIGSTGTLTSLILTGNMGDTITNALAATIATVDGSAGTGAEKFTMGGVAFATPVSIKTGTGNDFVNLAATWGCKDTVTTSDGNDTVVFGSSGAFANGSTFDGGNGTDIASIQSGAEYASLKGQLLNFETLDTSGGSGTYDLSLIPFTTVQIDAGIAGVNGAEVFTKAAAGFTFNELSAKSADMTTGGETITLATATGTSDVINLNYTSVDGNNNGVAQGQITDSITLNVSGDTTNSVETVNLSANVSVVDSTLTAANYTDNITITDGGMKTLTISGNESVNVTLVLGTPTLSTVDAHNSTGNITLSLASFTTAVNYTGSSGIDTFTESQGGGSIYAGSGNDQITLYSVHSAADTIVYKLATDTTQVLDGTGTKIAAQTLETVTNFASTADAVAGGFAAHDTIDLTAFSFTGIAKAVAQVGALSADPGGGTFAATSATLFTDAGGARGIAVGTFGGNTYVFVDANHDGTFNATQDLVIKLVGTHALTLSDFAA